MEPVVEARSDVLDGTLTVRVELSEWWMPETILSPATILPSGSLSHFCAFSFQPLKRRNDINQGINSGLFFSPPFCIWAVLQCGVTAMI